MKPDIVIDVGNSRTKWGWCVGGAITDVFWLLHDTGWQSVMDRWEPNRRRTCVVSGVQPQRRDELADWLRQRSVDVRVLSNDDLGISSVPRLHEVGIDRLLNVLAAKTRVAREAPIIIVDAGSAVTVDYVDTLGMFQGGSILPGFRLMAQVLHQYTALLPLTETPREPPLVPGTNTIAAIESGIFWTIAGGIKAIIRQIMADAPESRGRQVFLTGGDASVLAPVMDTDVIVWPEMTLEGIRLAAENLK